MIKRNDAGAIAIGQGKRANEALAPAKTECRRNIGANMKKPTRAKRVGFGLLVPLTGVELVTFALRMSCSTN